MGDTKERILWTALKLFAENGYEAVSVSDIAGALGITKGALYRHYRNKRDIFGSIVARMERRDAKQADADGMPAGALADVPEAYRAATVDRMIAFAKSMFRYWTQDPFASAFRRMLTLEQFRSPEMGALYQQYLAAGPVGYMEDLFASLGLPRAREQAVAFYAPMFLLYSVCDGAADGAAALATLDALMEDAREQLNRQLQDMR
ncbi:MAG: TetR/AcrR family transcriptional regulator [Clostridia bacterium]|nr:TetR/AcrR family transcriptional regulator [Clostridia bacterium]